MVFDKQFKQVVAFDGRKVDDPSKTFFRQPHFSFEGEKMIWFGGKTCVYIVDLTDLSIFLIDNLIPDEEDNPPEPLFTIADLKREKILTVFLFENENTLVYYEKDREPDLHLLSEIFPEYNEISCLDLGKNKIFGFLAGRKFKRDKVSGRQLKIPSITGFSFNKELKIAADFEFPITKCNKIGCVRVSPNHEDILYIASDGPLFVLGFSAKEKRFHILKAIDFKNDGNLNFLTN